MIWVLLISSFLWTTEASQSLTKIKALSLPVHDFCLQFFKESPQRAVHQALACGKNLEKSDPSENTLKSASIAVGIYHVLVVSGAHLTFLEKLLLKIKTPSIFIKIFLFLFCLMTHWDPPVVRALFESLVRKSTQSSWLCVYLSYALALCTHPQWIHSHSLHLSLAARAAFELPLKGPLSQTLVVTIFLWPLIHAWSPIQISIVLLSVLTAEVSLGIWFFSLFYFLGTKLLNNLSPEILHIFLLDWTDLKSLLILPHKAVDFLHFFLMQLSRWQSHEFDVFFRISQKELYLYGITILLITGILKNFSKKGISAT